MLMKPLQNTMGAECLRCLFRLASLTLVILLIVFSMLETTDESIGFVYNNF